MGGGQLRGIRIAMPKIYITGMGLEKRVSFLFFSFFFCILVFVVAYFFWYALYNAWLFRIFFLLRALGFGESISRVDVCGGGGGYDQC